MDMKLFDSELRIMEILWEEGEQSAKEIARILSEQVGWSKTTTYTVIKKCLDKGAVIRTEPGFICQAQITREQARDAETNELINKMYGGAPDRLIASLLGRKQLSEADIDKLKKLVEEME